MGWRGPWGNLTLLPICNATGVKLEGQRLIWAHSRISVQAREAQPDPADSSFTA